MENSPNYFGLYNCFVGPDNFIFWVQRHVVWSYRPYENLEQTDHNLHNHVFDDVICKPSIVRLAIWYINIKIFGGQKTRMDRCVYILAVLPFS